MMQRNDQPERQTKGGLKVVGRLRCLRVDPESLQIFVMYTACREQHKYLHADILDLEHLQESMLRKYNQ